MKKQVRIYYMFLVMKKLFVSDAYEKAVERLQCFQYSSDANSEKELVREKRKRRPAVKSDYDDESPGRRSDTTASEDEEYVPPKPPTPPALARRTSTALYLCYYNTISRVDSGYVCSCYRWM